VFHHLRTRQWNECTIILRPHLSSLETFPLFLLRLILLFWDVLFLRSNTMTSRSLFSTFATGQTRTILGPLTTTFTAPATCTLPVQQCTTCAVAWQGQDCYSSSADIRVRDNTQCWPAASGSIATQSASLPLKGWGFYSPGLICPTGYTSACSATGTRASNYNFQYAILPQETVVGCCPTYAPLHTPEQNRIKMGAHDRIVVIPAHQKK
jgi:hypothetical protein